MGVSVGIYGLDINIKVWVVPEESSNHHFEWERFSRASHRDQLDGGDLLDTSLSLLASRR